MLSVLFSTPCNSPLLRHPSTCMQTPKPRRESSIDVQRPLPVPFLRGFHSFLVLFAHIFPPFIYKLSELGPLASFLPLAFLLPIWLQGFGRSTASSKMLWTSQYSIQVQQAVPNAWEQTHHLDKSMSHKSLAANIKSFQVSSFSWVCNAFIATQICVYKKTCLPSTWQKPAEVELQKHKWEERYFLGGKISIQDWKQDGKQLRKTLGFPVQGNVLEVHSTS